MTPPTESMIVDNISGDHILHYDVPQNTEAWHDLRKSKVNTASIIMKDLIRLSGIYFENLKKHIDAFIQFILNSTNTSK